MFVIRKPDGSFVQKRPWYAERHTNDLQKARVFTQVGHVKTCKDYNPGTDKIHRLNIELAEEVI